MKNKRNGGYSYGEIVNFARQGKKPPGKYHESSSTLFRKLLKRNIIDSETIPLLGLDHEYNEVYNLVKRTVDKGESNSALIIGPRGSGKSSLVCNVLQRIKTHSPRSNDTIIVKLNGYIHTDDRLALIAITSQMKLENSVGDKVFGSFAENFTFLLRCLRVGNHKTSKSVIYILDEFDLFCNHRNQTLLYNLFDIAQSAQAPICVLGLTCRNDVTELLEKRVVSRFSNRQIHLFPNSGESEEKSFERRINLLKSILTLSKTDGVSAVEEWNKRVSGLCSDTVVKDCLKTMFEISQCESTFRNYLFLVVSKINDNHTLLNSEDFVEAYEQMKFNTRIAMLEGLSVLELCLVISMKHETEIHDGNPFNFEMILRRYLKFANQHSMSNVDRQVVLKAFENLKRLELIQPANSAASVLKEFQLFNLLVLPDEIREAVNNYQGLPTEVSQWAKSDLT